MSKHLSILGAGPVIVGFMVILTLVGIALNEYGCLESGLIGQYFWGFCSLGGVLMVAGVVLFIAALLFARMVQNIKSNHLITSGVYSIVRNPLYSGFLAFTTGVLLLFGNLWLLIIPIINWAFMTFVLKRTEECWLLEQYGDEYKEYCRRVNRCIPWFAKK